MSDAGELKVKAPTEEGLDRALGVRQLAANIVNTVIGSGIFVLPATVAGLLGASALLAYLAAAVVTALTALVFAECGSRVRTSGGPSAYIEAAFGPMAGAVAGTLNYLGTVVAAGAVANVFVGAIVGLSPALAGPWPRAALMVSLFAGLGVLNYRGVRGAARLVEVTTVAKLAPLSLLAVVGLFFVQPANLEGFRWPPAGEVASAALLLSFAFQGAESALAPSGEVSSPARTVPRAIALSLVVITALYGTIQLVAQGVLGPDLAVERSAPLAAAAGRIGGAPAATFILVGAAISTFGYLTSTMLSAPRLLFGLGRDGTLPSALGRAHPRFRTPHVAVTVHGVLGCALALGGTFGPLALLSSVAVVALYLGCAVAVFSLRRRGVHAGGAPFVIPGGALVPALAVLANGWLLTSATRAEYLAVGLVALATVGLRVAGRGASGR